MQKDDCLCSFIKPDNQEIRISICPAGPDYNRYHVLLITCCYGNGTGVLRTICSQAIRKSIILDVIMVVLKTSLTSIYIALSVCLSQLQVLLCSSTTLNIL